MSFIKNPYKCDSWFNLFAFSDTSLPFCKAMLFLPFRTSAMRPHTHQKAVCSANLSILDACCVSAKQIPIRWNICILQYICNFFCSRHCHLHSLSPDPTAEHEQRRTLRGHRTPQLVGALDRLRIVPRLQHCRKLPRDERSNGPLRRSLLLLRPRHHILLDAGHSVVLSVSEGGHYDDRTHSTSFGRVMHDFLHCGRRDWHHFPYPVQGTGSAEVVSQTLCVCYFGQN